MALLISSELLDGFNMGPVTLRRTTTGALNAYGGREAGVTTEIELDPVVVHPLSGSELDQLPEADRTVETVRIYAAVALSKETDRLVWRGASYRLTAVDDLDVQGGVYLAIAQREETPAPEVTP